MKTNKKAFSLVELLVVISIIAILAALTFAVMGTSMSKTKDAGSLAIVKSLYTAIEAYKNEVGYYPEPQGNYYISNGTSGVKILGSSGGF
ncbi:MAG: type II secretion system protein, partial [Planctomycetota bacterium]